MALLSKEKEVIKNDYFRVWDIVELLYKKTDNNWDEVGKFLGHYDFDTELTLYRQDAYCRINEVVNNYLPIRKLIDGLNMVWLEGEESIQNIKLDIINYYWHKHEIYNFKPIIDLGIIEKPKKEISFSKAPKPISPLNGISYTNTVDTPSYLRVLALSDYFTIFDAACLMSLDEPEIANDINYDDGFRYGEHKQAIKVIESGIKANKLQVDSEWQIPRRSLQYFLHERGYILSGFNDKLPEQEFVDGEISSIQQSHQEIERLKADLAKAQERIRQLEADQPIGKSEPNNLLDLIFDESATERYAPDLALSIRLWEHIYITNSNTDSHSNNANSWLKSNTGYDVAKKQGSASKIREITNPFLKWGTHRDKKYKK